MNIAVIWGGYNDFHAGESVATVYSYLTQFAQHERQLGFKVIVGTVISGVGVDTQRDQLNTLLRQNWPAFADGLADIAANPTLGTDGSYANATYYQPDQVHLTDVGYSLVGSLFQPAITTLVQSNNTYSTNMSIFGALNVGTTSVASTTKALFTVSSGSNVPLIVSNGGNVGIGTSTPYSYYKLNIYSAANSYVGLQSTGQYNLLDMDSLFASGTGDNAIRFLDNGVTRWSVGQSGSNSDAFTFSNSSLLSSAPKMTLTTAGRLGIGTSSPLDILHIEGSSNNTFGLIVQNDNSVAVSAGLPILQVSQVGSSGFGISGWANASLIEAGTVGGLVLDAYGSNGGPILFQTNRTTQMALTHAGNLAIGTTTPYARLSVWGPDAASSTLAFNIVNSASTTLFAVFDGGNAQLSGTLTQSSDRRLKTNITSLDASSSLTAINSLNPVTYTWIDPSKGSAMQLGFIAQDVQQIFPDLVSTTSATALTPDGTLGINYLGFIAPLIKAVQTLSQQITNLTGTVSGFATNFVSDHITVTTMDVGVANIQTANVQDATIQNTKTQTLCVGNTCITESQLQQLLQQAGQSSSPAPSSAPETSATSSDPAPTPDPEPQASTSSSTPPTPDAGTATTTGE